MKGGILDGQEIGICSASLRDTLPHQKKHKFTLLLHFLCMLQVCVFPWKLRQQDGLLGSPGWMGKVVDKD